MFTSSPGRGGQSGKASFINESTSSSSPLWASQKSPKGAPEEPQESRESFKTIRLRPPPISTRAPRESVRRGLHSPRRAPREPQPTSHAENFPKLACPEDSYLFCAEGLVKCGRWLAQCAVLVCLGVLCFAFWLPRHPSISGALASSCSGLPCFALLS